MQLLTNVRKTDDRNQIFIVCLYLTTFFRAGTQVVDKSTEVAVLRLANAKQTISKLYEGNLDVFAINIVNALKLLSANNIQ